jgi:hypothetical protein
MLLLMAAVAGHGQTVGSFSQLTVKDVLRIPPPVDTPATGKVGAMVWKKTTGQLYVRNSAGTAWVLINGSGSGGDIYTTNGTLTGSRTIAGANNSITFNGLESFNVVASDAVSLGSPSYVAITTPSTSVSGRFAIGSMPLTTDTNMIAVVWDSVSNRLSRRKISGGGGGGSYAASNGLSLSGSDFKIGGSLSENTNIGGEDAHDFMFNNLVNFKVVNSKSFITELADSFVVVSPLTRFRRELGDNSSIQEWTTNSVNSSVSDISTGRVTTINQNANTYSIDAFDPLAVSGEPNTTFTTSYGNFDFYNGKISMEGDVGITGQVLTSRGTSGTPIWSTITSGDSSIHKYNLTLTGSRVLNGNRNNLYLGTGVDSFGAVNQLRGYTNYGFHFADYYQGSRISTTSDANKLHIQAGKALSFGFMDSALSTIPALRSDTGVYAMVIDKNTGKWGTRFVSSVGSSVDTLNRNGGVKSIFRATQDSIALAAAIGAKEPTITAGTTAQYWRGDKTWQTLPVQDTTTNNTGLVTDFQRDTATAARLSAIAGKVGLSGNETVAGNKTLTGQTQMNGLLYMVSNIGLATTAYNINLSGGYGNNHFGFLNAFAPKINLENSQASYFAINNSTSGVVALVDRFGSMGLGASSINASAALDVSSTTKGALFPRMTTAQRIGIGTPATGLMVYDLTLSRQFNYNGTSWRPVQVGGQVALTDGATITWNALNGARAYVTLGGNRTLTITNAIDGDYGELLVTQDATGSRTLSTDCLRPDGGSALALSTGANKVDLIAWRRINGNFYFNVVAKDFVCP